MAPKNPPTNLLKALLNAKNSATNDLSKAYVIPKSNPSAVNRANTMGDALEAYIRDIFCGRYPISQASAKQTAYSANFSYLGNQNNPPDIMIKGGDAIEVKKIEGVKSHELALNSSYPKEKLYADSPMITTACRDCEEWAEKDLVYCVGGVEGRKLKALVFVYGDCYAASREVYERVRKMVSAGIENLGLELSPTNELGRVNKVDPLGITNLRIRGMWTIKAPLMVFSELFRYDPKSEKLAVFALMRERKYASFPKADRDLVEKAKGFKIQQVKIREPDNPVKPAEATLISFVV